MVKWISDERRQEKRIRYAIEMIKRKTSGQCIICEVEIKPGDKCFYFEVEINRLQYPVRRYICIKCHNEVTAKPEIFETAYATSFDF